MFFRVQRYRRLFLIVRFPLKTGCLLKSSYFLPICLHRHISSSPSNILTTEVNKRLRIVTYQVKLASKVNTFKSP
jgi:hypothetical protein